MSRRHDSPEAARALAAALGTGKAPPTREDRVRMIAEVAEALLRGEVPRLEARMHVGGALAGWLENGGDLVKKYLKVKSRQGDRTTATKIWHSLPHHNESEPE